MILLLLRLFREVASVDFRFYIRTYSAFEITIIIQLLSQRAADEVTMRLELSNFANMGISYVLRSSSDVNKNDNANSNY